MTQETFSLIPTDSEGIARVWEFVRDAYLDPHQVQFRRAVKQSGEYDKLVQVHPEVADFKEPETEGMLVVDLQVAFKSGTIHATDVDDFLESAFNTYAKRSKVAEYQIESMAVHEVLPRPHYRIGDVFENPISVMEIE